MREKNSFNAAKVVIFLGFFVLWGRRIFALSFGDDGVAVLKRHC